MILNNVGHKVVWLVIKHPHTEFYLIVDLHVLVDRWGVHYSRFSARHILAKIFMNALFLYSNLHQIMPRISEKREALQAVSTTIESTIFICLIESSSEEEEDLEDDLEDLAIIYDVITSQRYLASRDSTAGRHADNSLEASSIILATCKTVLDSKGAII